MGALNIFVLLIYILKQKEVPDHFSDHGKALMIR